MSKPTRKKAAKKVVKKAVKKSGSHAPTLKEHKYRATLYALGKRFIGVGLTIQEAVAAVKVQHLKGKAVLEIQNLHTLDEKSRILMPVVAYRAFCTLGTTRTIATKQLADLFGV